MVRPYRGDILKLAKPNPFVAMALAIVTTTVPARSALAGQTSAGAAQGAAPPPSASRQGGVEILSDTRGVDFGPYLKVILKSIRQKWVTFVPEEARPPNNAAGVTLIRFTINADGQLAAMHLDASDHKIAMDRAAWGAITSQGKFPPLPSAFTGPNLEIRVEFRLNMPPKGEPDLAGSAKK